MFRLLFHRQDTMTLVGRLSLAVTGLLLLLLIWTTWSHNLFDTYGLAPHGYCFLWNSQLITLHVVSDTLIGLSYVFISGTLFYFVRSIYQDLPFRWIFLAFGGFIIACGATHFLDVWTLWYATYWLSGTVKLITAIASLSTAIILPPLIPKARMLIAHARASEERKKELELAHQELEVLYQRAQQTRQVLQRELTSQSQDIVSLSNELILRKHELESSNEQLHQMSHLQQDFISMVSHEFRTTLTSIQGFSELLHIEEFGAQEVKDYSRSIYLDTKRLVRMISDLLDLERMKSGLQSLRREYLDLNALLTDIVARKRATLFSQHTIRLQLEETLSITGDEDKLTQLFLNLLSNAVKYSPEGGEIVVSCSKDGPDVHLCIQDHGIGIASEDVPKLFTAYSRIDAEKTRYIKGTGLGLAIVQQISELHGGCVWVESTPGQGSTFHVSLSSLPAPGTS